MKGYFKRLNVITLEAENDAEKLLLQNFSHETIRNTADDCVEIIVTDGGHDMESTDANRKAGRIDVLIVRSPKKRAIASVKGVNESEHN
jgi:hypothetical protein